MPKLSDVILAFVLGVGAGVWLYDLALERAMRSACATSQPVTIAGVTVTCGEKK